MKKLILPLLILIASAGVFAAQLKPVDKLRQAEQLIENYYVDEVNADSLVEEAIRAMLKTLDPHSSYATPEETRKLNEPLEGKFSGIGISYNMLNDTLYVLEVISGGPSEQVGLLPGDRIINAGDSAISGVKRSTDDIKKILRGPKGTEINVEVLRRGEPITFHIVRDDIPIYSVDAYYMIDKENGYVRVTRFAEDTPEELRRAIRDLKKKGMKNLVIDLESNGGGYLNSAFEMGNLFLDEGDMIVFTGGDRVRRINYRADHPGEFQKGRVVVMVNQYSASASEILSGALQDQDRAVIVGRRTFGKGLVQSPFPFSDGSMIRLTTRRYYTPSGRCIQKHYDLGDEDSYDKDITRRYEGGELTSADSIHFDESLRYETLKNGRTVYGGGGIMPDVFVPLDTVAFTKYYRNLLAKNVLNPFCIAYVDQNRDQLLKKYKTEDSFIEKYTVSDDLLSQLVEQAGKDGVEYNAEEFALSREYLRSVVKALIARDLFTQTAYYRVMNLENPTYVEAVKVITDPARYSRILSGE